MPARNKMLRDIVLGAIVGLGSPAISTGADAHGPTSVSHHVTETRWGVPGNPARVAQTVKIIATEIKFDVAHLTFRRGDTIRFVFVNKGEQPHEFMIADAAEQAEHRKMMSAMAGTSMPAGGNDEGNVVDAEPGESKELIWRFTKKGRFQFACNYIGHAEAGMIGTIDVR